MVRIGEFAVQISHHPFYISVEKKGKTIFFTQSIEEARNIFGKNYDDEKHILNTLYGAGVVVREKHVHNLKSYWGGWYCTTPNCPTKKYQRLEPDHHGMHGMHKNLDGSTKNHHPNNLGKIPEWKL